MAVLSDLVGFERALARFAGPERSPAGQILADNCRRCSGLPTRSPPGPGGALIVETAIDIARDAGGLSFDELGLDARGRLCLAPRTPPYLAGVVAAVRALSAQTCGRCGGPGDPVHVAGEPFPTTRCAACRAWADALLPRPRWRRDVDRERVAVRRALLAGGVRTLPVVEDVVGDEDLAALMDARYRPTEHVGWPCTLVGREHGLVRQANWRRIAGESPAEGRNNQPPSPRVMRRSL